MKEENVYLFVLKTGCQVQFKCYEATFTIRKNNSSECTNNGVLVSASRNVNLK